MCITENNWGKSLSVSTVLKDTFFVVGTNAKPTDTPTQTFRLVGVALQPKHRSPFCEQENTQKHESNARQISSDKNAYGAFESPLILHI